MTTPLFLLQYVEVGISIIALDILTIGIILDMWTEKENDGVVYDFVANQDDIDFFYVTSKIITVIIVDIYMKNIFIEIVIKSTNSPKYNKNL